MTDYDKAMRSPTSVYKLPREVIADDSLTKEQKISILRQWEYDARELSVAEEENMRSSSGDEPNMLNRIKLALEKLGVEGDGSSGAKQ